MRRLAIAALCLLPIVAPAQDTAIERDKGVLTRFLEEQLSGDGNIIDIQGFEGALSTRATIDRLSVADEQGEWLVLNDLVFDWDRSALVTGRKLVVQELRAGAIDFERRPVTAPAPPSAQAEPLRLPKLPVSVYVGALDAPLIRLGDGVVGDPVTLALAGQAALTGERVFADVTAQRTDGAEGALALKLDYDEEAGQLQVDLRLHEQDNGILAGALNLPGAPSVDLAIKGAGPIDAFSADIALRSDDQDRLSGQIGLAQTGADQKISVDLAGDMRALFAADYQPFFGDHVALRSQIARAADGMALEQLQLNSGALSLTGSARLDQDWWPTAFDIDADLGLDNGTPVLIPMPGPRSFVRSARLSADYDVTQGPDWRAELALSDLDRPEFSAAQVALDLNGTIDRDATGPGWSALGAYSVDGLTMTDPGLALAIGPEISGGLALGGGSDTAIDLGSFTLVGPGLNMSGRAQISGSDEDFQTDAGLFIVATDMGRFSAIAGRDLSGSAQMRADLRYRPLDRAIALDLEGTTLDLGVGIDRIAPVLAGTGALRILASRDATGTRIDTFVLQTDQADIHGTADVTNTDAQVDFAANLEDSSAISGDLTGPMSLTLTATRIDGGNTNAVLSAQLPQATARVDAVLGPNSDAYPSQISGNIRFQDLTPYSDLAGRDLQGRGTVTFDGDGHLGTGDFDVGLDARTFDLAIGQSQLDALLAGAAQLEGRLKRNAAADFYVLEKLDIRSGQMTGTAHGAAQNGVLVANLDAVVPDGAVLAPGLDGAITVQGRARQSDSDGMTHLTLDAQAPAASIDAEADLDRAGRGTFLAAIQVDDLAPYGALAARDMAGQLRLTMKGGLGDGEDALHIDLNGNGQDLVLDRSIPALNVLLQGASTLSVKAKRDDQGTYQIDNATLFGTGLQMRGEGVIGPRDLQGSLAARLPDLQQLDVGLSGPGDIRLDATPDGAATQIRLVATATGTEIEGHATMQSRARAYATEFDLFGEIGDLRLIAGLTGSPLRGAATVLATGTAKPTRGRFDAEIQGTTGGLSLGQSAVDAVVGGSGSYGARISRNEAGTLRLQNGRVRLPNLVASADGRRTADGQLITEFEARIPEISQISSSLVGGLTITGTTRIGDTGSIVNANLTGVGGSSAQVAGRIRPSGRPDLAITGQLPLALANRAVAPQALSGVASLDLRLRDSWELSNLTGVVRTSDARVSIPQRGTAIEGVAGTLTLQGSRAALSLQGREQRGGILSASGTIDLRDRWPADLRITAQGVTIRDPALFDTTADADLTIQGPLHGGGALIGGKVTLARTEIRVPNSALGRIGPMMDIRHTNASNGARQTLGRAGLTIAGVDLRRGGDATTGSGAREQIAYPLDIEVAAPARIFVRGRGIDAELGGSFALRGTTRRMIPSGRLELIRGRINILQQRFTLDEGFGMLEGDFTPYIFLSASTERDEITTFITIEGDLSEPDITFSSAPELPQDEVLARLIFGRDLSNISPLQAIQLASALNTLSGRGDVGIVNSLRQSVGLDDLDLAADETGKAELRAGKYITDDLYVDSSIDTDGKATINLNLDVSPDLTLKGSSDTDGRSSIGLFFEKDY